MDIFLSITNWLDVAPCLIYNALGNNKSGLDIFYNINYKIYNDIYVLFSFDQPSMNQNLVIFDYISIIIVYQIHLLLFYIVNIIEVARYSYASLCLYVYVYIINLSLNVWLFIFKILGNLYNNLYIEYFMSLI